MHNPVGAAIVQGWVLQIREIPEIPLPEWFHLAQMVVAKEPAMHQQRCIRGSVLYSDKIAKAIILTECFGMGEQPGIVWALEKAIWLNARLISFLTCWSVIIRCRLLCLGRSHDNLLYFRKPQK